MFSLVPQTGRKLFRREAIVEMKCSLSEEPINDDMGAGVW